MAVHNAELIGLIAKWVPEKKNCKKRERKEMKGLFIPEITEEMFRNGCLESIEALMAEGEIYDVEYPQWTPISKETPDEKLPKDFQRVLVTVENYAGDKVVRTANYISLRRSFRVIGSSNWW